MWGKITEIELFCTPPHFLKDIKNASTILVLQKSNPDIPDGET
jgi:hypothetical protein